MPKYRERPPLGYFWLMSDDKDIGFLDGMLGRQFPVVVDGYGKWSEQERRRRRAALRWDGSPPLRVKFDVLLSSRSPRVRQDDSVETEIRQLEKMAGLVYDGYEPPLIEWAANGPHDYIDAKNVDWVIDDLTWSDDKVDYKWNDHGQRTQAHASVVLATFTEVTYIKADVPKSMQQKKKAKDKKNSGGKKSAKVTNYTIVAGDTLSKIASAQLGSASRYPEIAKLNNIRDPRNIRVGQVLVLP